MKKKLKIALFFSSSPDEVGGVQEHVYMLSASLRALGHQVDIFGPQKMLDTYNFGNYTEVCESRQVSTINGTRSAFAFDIPTTKKSIGFIQKNYDILHIHEPYNPFTSWRLLLKCELPIVTTFHTAWNNSSIISSVDGILGAFKKKYSEVVQGNIYVSEAAQKCWELVCDRSVNQVVIPNGVDTVFVPPVKKRKNKKVELLFLARIVPRKGLQHLLKALSHLSHKERSKIHLTVVGDGPYLETAKSTAKWLGVSTYVSFVGAVYGNERVQYYQKADVFCAPYSDEAFGMTVLEAMACGCAIVGFENDGFEKMLDAYPNKDALIVQQKDTQALSKGLSLVLSHSDLRSISASWVMKKSAQFSWKETAQHTIDFYHQCILDYKK